MRNHSLLLGPPACFLPLLLLAQAGCATERSEDGAGAMDYEAQENGEGSVPPTTESPSAVAGGDDSSGSDVPELSAREPSAQSSDVAIVGEAEGDEAEAALGPICVTLNDCGTGFFCSAETDPPRCVEGEAAARGPLGQAPPPPGLFEVGGEMLEGAK